MFDRVLIKEEAKSRMKNRYWLLVLVTWVASLLGGWIMSGTNPSPTSFFSSLVEMLPIENLTEEQAMIFAAWLLILLVVTLVVGVISIGFILFVGNVTTVGLNRWFLQQWRDESPSFGVLFSPFRHYGKTFCVMGAYSGLIYLWMLVFLIPGIIKSYTYSMVPFLAAEHPHLSAKQTLKLSKALTDGYKGELFKMHLSFIGWGLLSSLTGGVVGILYANPYIGMTWAGAYEQLKENAIQSGRLTEEDFE